MRFVAETAHSHFNRPMPFFSCKRFLVVALKTCFSQSRSYCHRLIVFVASVAPLLLPWHVPARPFLHFITPFYYRLRFRLPSRQRHRADYAIIKESIIFKGASGIYFLRYFHANYTEKSYKSQVY